MRLPGFLESFARQHPTLYGLAGDLLFSIVVVAAIGLLLFAYAGTWPAIVSVVGDSMYPHMHDGDLVLLQGLDRASIITYNAAAATNYTQYAEPGDVIVYRPYGRTDLHPVIHRAIRWVNASEPMWPGGPAAPESGFITLGDNNRGACDQMAPNICYLQPVEPGWIIGIARYNVPYLGFIRSLVPW